MQDLKNTNKTPLQESLAKNNVSNFLQKWGVLIGLILLGIYFTISSRHFLTISNILNIARQTSIKAIIAVGMTYIIITCGIDLSVGSAVGLSAVVTAVFITNMGLPPIVAIVLTLLVGCVIGLVNGISVAYVNIPPFIITLAMMTIVRGVAFVITGGYPVYIDSPVMLTIGRGFILGIPTPVYFNQYAGSAERYSPLRTAFFRSTKRRYRI